MYIFYDFLGFPPTFGPTFIHMYGSTRDYSILDKHATLNTGLGEGVSYRARVLVAIRTEITENTELMNSGVDVEPTYPITEVKQFCFAVTFAGDSAINIFLISRRRTVKTKSSFYSWPFWTRR